MLRRYPTYFFTDDSVIFAHALEDEADVILSILGFYEDSSGQKINLDKS